MLRINTKPLSQLRNDGRPLDQAQSRYLDVCASGGHRNRVGV
jgi:hypothetical protein